MTIKRYTLSIFLLFSLFRLTAQYSIVNTQNPDVPFIYSADGDGTRYALGKGIVGDYYYTNRLTEFGSYQEFSYYLGAYSGNFQVTAGQKYERVAVIQLNGQSLQIDRIAPDGTLDDFITYDFPASSTVELMDVFSSQYYYDRSIYITGLETNAANEKVIFTIRFDEFLAETWREDLSVDNSVEAVEITDNIRRQGDEGFLTTYIRPVDFSLQAFYRNYDGTLIWQDEIMNSAAENSIPSLNHAYVSLKDAYLYGSYETQNGDTTVYFAYHFDSETNTPILEKETPYVTGSTDDNGAYQIQSLNIFPTNQYTYVEVGTSYKYNPDGQLYITKKTIDGHVEWYKEYDFLAEVRYVHAYGYLVGMKEGEAWFAYFDQNGNLERREGACQSTTNLATNACITMSSEVLGGAANQAIDGQVNNSAATSTAEYLPWMLLDLGAIYLIDSIRIYPSNDADKLLQNTRLYADLHPIPEDVTRAHMTIEWQSPFYNTPVTAPFTISTYNSTTGLNFPARYFSLHKLGYGILEIEEIEIFGCIPANCKDNDGDGFCFTEDCNDFDAIVPALPGTPCDDGNPLTENDVIQQDHCTCLGESDAIDFDNDGLPSSEDCNDYGDVSCSHRLLYVPTFNHGTLDPNSCECFTNLSPIGCSLNYQVDGSTLTIYGVEDDGQTGINLFDANWQVIFNCDTNDCNESVIEITNLPDGQYYLNAQIWPLTDCTLEETITIDQNACVDVDGDGICAIDDPDPTNGNIPAVPGTVCNDCNPDTENDMIQADGITCAGTLIACPDSDEDGVCAADDCDDENPNIPTTPGAICDDGDTATENDVIQADGCTCLGEIIPCIDLDEDGICEEDDCDDNNAAIPTTPNTPCDDGDAATENDVIQSDGCTCLGELPCPDLDEDGVCADEDCDDENPDLPTLPGTPCSDGNPNTGNDVIQADGCTCVGMVIITPFDDYSYTFIGNNSGTITEVEIAEKSLKNKKTANVVQLFPNPATNYMTILFYGETIAVEEIVIYNSQGQIQSRFYYPTVVGRNVIEMDISDLADGVYFVKMSKARVVERLVKL